MAFIGVPVIKQISDRKVRITGVQLAADGADGIIGLYERVVAPDIRLPEGFMPRPFSRPDGDISLIDSVSTQINFLNPPAVNPPIIKIEKSNLTPEDFEIVVTNRSTAATDELEIYVEFH